MTVADPRRVPLVVLDQFFRLRSGRNALVEYNQWHPETPLPIIEA